MRTIYLENKRMKAMVSREFKEVARVTPVFLNISVSDSPIELGRLVLKCMQNHCDVQNGKDLWIIPTARSMTASVIAAGFQCDGLEAKELRDVVYEMLLCICNAPQFLNREEAAMLM